MGQFEWLANRKGRKRADGVMARILQRIQMGEGYNRHRENNRMPTSVSVRIIPYQEGRLAREAMFAAVTKDINATGISFVHDARFSQGDRMVVTVEMDGQPQHLLCEVRHSTSMDRGLFLTGCLVVDEIADSPDLAD